MPLRSKTATDILFLPFSAFLHERQNIGSPWRVKGDISAGRPVEEGRRLRVAIAINHIGKLRVAIFCRSGTSRSPCLLSALMRLKIAMTSSSGLPAIDNRCRFPEAGSRQTRCGIPAPRCGQDGLLGSPSFWRQRLTPIKDCQVCHPHDVTGISVRVK